MSLNFIPILPNYNSLEDLIYNAEWIRDNNDIREILEREDAPELVTIPLHNEGNIIFNNQTMQPNISDIIEIIQLGNNNTYRENNIRIYLLMDINNGDYESPYRDDDFIAVEDIHQNYYFMYEIIGTNFSVDTLRNQGNIDINSDSESTLSSFDNSIENVNSDIQSIRRIAEESINRDEVIGVDRLHGGPRAEEWAEGLDSSIIDRDRELIALSGILTLDILNQDPLDPTLVDRYHELKDEIFRAVDEGEVDLIPSSIIEIIEYAESAAMNNAPFLGSAILYILDRNNDLASEENFRIVYNGNIHDSSSN